MTKIKLDAVARQQGLAGSKIVPEGLKRMTAQIVRRWGLPEDVDPQDMIARGLMSADGRRSSKPMPRWKCIPSAAQVRKF